MAYSVIKAMEYHAAITSGNKDSIQKSSFDLAQQLKTYFFRPFLLFYANILRRTLSEQLLVTFS